MLCHPTPYFPTPGILCSLSLNSTLLNLSVFVGFYFFKPIDLRPDWHTITEHNLSGSDCPIRLYGPSYVWFELWRLLWESLTLWPKFMSCYQKVQIVQYINFIALEHVKPWHLFTFKYFIYCDRSVSSLTMATLKWYNICSYVEWTSNDEYN